MTMLPNIEEAMEDARNGKLSPYWQNNLKRECLHGELSAEERLALSELNGILSEMAEHERQRTIAIEQGDREREEAQRALILTCGTQRGIRKGAADAAKRELDQALSDGGFASCEEARAVRLSEPDLTSLSAEIEAYQADYAETLAACERIEAAEAASADAEGVEEA